MDKQRIIAVGRAGRLLDHLEQVFGESPVDVQRVEQPDQALALAETFPIDLILAEHPLAGTSAASFATAMLRCAAGGELEIVFVSTAEDWSALAESVGDSHAVIGCSDPESFRSAVAGQLRQWPTRAERLMVKMQVRFGDGERSRMAQTENISASGLLIRTRDLPDLDTEVELEFDLPGDHGAVRVNGRVVRHMPAGDNGIGGIGVNFTAVAAEAAERLRDFLEHEAVAAPA